MSRSLPIVSGLPITTPFRDTKRPHYWYIAASNCGGRDLDLRYDFHFTNPGSSRNCSYFACVCASDVEGTTIKALRGRQNSATMSKVRSTGLVFVQYTSASIFG